MLACVPLSFYMYLGKPQLFLVLLASVLSLVEQCVMFPLSLLCVPDSRLIPSVRASITVVSITAAAASLSSSSHCQSKGGRGGKEVGERLRGRARRRDQAVRSAAAEELGRIRSSARGQAPGVSHPLAGGTGGVQLFDKRPGGGVESGEQKSERARLKKLEPGTKRSRVVCV